MRRMFDVAVVLASSTLGLALACGGAKRESSSARAPEAARTSTSTVAPTGRGGGPRAPISSVAPMSIENLDTDTPIQPHFRPHTLPLPPPRMPPPAAKTEVPLESPSVRAPRSWSSSAASTTRGDWAPEGSDGQWSAPPVEAPHSPPSAAPVESIGTWPSAIPSSSVIPAPSGEPPGDEDHAPESQ